MNRAISLFFRSSVSHSLQKSLEPRTSIGLPTFQMCWACLHVFIPTHSKSKRDIISRWKFIDILVNFKVVLTITKS